MTMMILKSSHGVQENNISEAFRDLQNSSNQLRICFGDGNISLINSGLIRFTSPYINNLLNDVPCSSSQMIYIPDASKSAVEFVISIITQGFGDFNSSSVKDVEEIIKTAKMLGIDLTDLDYVEKISTRSFVSELQESTSENTNADAGGLVIDLAPNSETDNDEQHILDNKNKTESKDLKTIHPVELQKENLAQIRIKTEISDVSLEYSETVHGNDSFIDQYHVVKKEPKEEANMNLDDQMKIKYEAIEHKKAEESQMSFAFSPTPPPESLTVSPESAFSTKDSNMAIFENKDYLDHVQTPPPESCITQLDTFSGNPTQPSSPEKRGMCMNNGVVKKNEVVNNEPYNPFDQRAKTKWTKVVGAERETFEKEKQGPEDMEKTREDNNYAKYSDPQKSQIPELQYIYRNVFHIKCRETHRRIDLCRAAPAHARCGKRHSYARECDGSWMKLKKFEKVAARWPDTKMNKRLSNTSGMLEDSPKRKKNHHDVSSKKNFMEMTEFEKMLATCLDWNSGRCRKCKYGNEKQHRCSKMVRDGETEERICWGKHREVEHE